MTSTASPITITGMSTTDSGAAAEGLEVTPATFPPARYPQAERLDVVEELHSRRVPDPYRRLEDPAAEDTVAWSAAQDELYTAFQGAWKDGEAKREAFRNRLTQL